MRIVVFHSYYGCETGCCGHTVQIREDEGVIDDYFDFLDDDKFSFAHPSYGDHLEFAKNLVETTFGIEHVADLDWENCMVVED